MQILESMHLSCLKFGVICSPCRWPLSVIESPVKSKLPTTNCLSHWMAHLYYKIVCLSAQSCSFGCIDCYCCLIACMWIAACMQGNASIVHSGQSPSRHQHVSAFIVTRLLMTNTRLFGQEQSCMITEVVLYLYSFQCWFDLHLVVLVTWVEPMSQLVWKVDNPSLQTLHSRQLTTGS